jgi:hypothetical protein
MGCMEISIMAHINWTLLWTSVVENWKFKYLEEVSYVEFYQNL